MPRRIVDVVNPPGRTPIDLRRLAPYAASPGAGEEIESMASRLSSWRWGLDTIVSEFARVAATLVVSALVIASVTLGSVWILQRTLPDEIDFGFLEGLLDEDPGGDAEADG